MTDLIRVDTDERITRIQLNRPEKKNALTQAMYVALVEAIAAAEADPAVRVLLVHGSESAFTAGNDIGDFLAGFPMGEESPVRRFLHALALAPKPVVAAVNGAAVGVGTTMLLHCDLVYCGRGARFQLPFVNLGLVPEAGSSYLLPAIMGHRHAAKLLLLGEPFGAEEAHAAGIVNRVVPDGDVLETALQAARTLAAKPPAALRIAKSLLKGRQWETLRAVMDEEAAHFAERLRSPEASEALQAFVERRQPDFSRFE
jgi:enoyl-CoA hydratase/carnithine racemase